MEMELGVVYEEASSVIRAAWLNLSGEEHDEN